MANVANGVLKIEFNTERSDLINEIAEAIRTAEVFSYDCEPSVEIKTQAGDITGLIVGFTCKWTGEACWDWLDEQMAESSGLQRDAQELLIKSSIQGSVNESGCEWEEVITKGKGHRIILRDEEKQHWDTCAHNNKALIELIVSEDGSLRIPFNILTDTCNPGDWFEIRMRYKEAIEMEKVDMNELDLQKNPDPDWHASVAEDLGISLSLKTLVNGNFKPGDLFLLKICSRELINLDYVGEWAVESQLPKAWRYLENEQRIKMIFRGEAAPEVLQVLAESEDNDLRRAIVLWENTPQSILVKLSSDRDIWVREAFSERSLSTDWRYLNVHELVEKLKSNHQELDTININDLLSIFAKSPSWNIRREVALHPRTSDEILDHLMADEDNEVQAAVKVAKLRRSLPSKWRELDDALLVDRIESMKENIDPDVLEILSFISGPEVREAIAKCSTVTPEILAKLCEDDNCEVQWTALSVSLPLNWKNIEIPWDEDDDELLYFLESQFEEYKVVDSAVLEAMARSSHWVLRMAVAQYKFTPSSIIARLHEDEDSDIREVVFNR